MTEPIQPTSQEVSDIREAFGDERRTDVKYKLRRFHARRWFALLLVPLSGFIGYYMAQRLDQVPQNTQNIQLICDKVNQLGDHLADLAARSGNTPEFKRYAISRYKEIRCRIPPAR